MSFDAAVQRSSRQLDARGEREQPGRRFYYQPLIRARITNEYFPTGDASPAGLQFLPTPTTSDLMQRLGLLLETSGDGLAILYDVKRDAGLGAVLSGAIAQHEPLRLAFALVVQDPCFVNYSGIPLDTNPTVVNFYLTNYRRPAPAEGDWLPLTVEDHVSELDEIDCTAVKFRVVLPPGTDALVVYDIFDREVRCYPRKVSPEAAARKDPDDFTCADYDPDGIAREFIYVNLAELPEGKYRLSFQSLDRKVVSPDKWVLYTRSYPTPLCFIDLVLDHHGGPDDSAGGTKPALYVYPNYEARFLRREVRWRYFVVLGADKGQYCDLEIEVEAPSDVWFERLAPERLTNGALALPFLSSRPLPLELRSRCRFSLVGRLGQHGPRRTLVTRLAVPSPALLHAATLRQPPHVSARRLERDQALPQTSSGIRATVADIYVHF